MATPTPSVSPMESDESFEGLRGGAGPSAGPSGSGPSSGAGLSGKSGKFDFEQHYEQRESYLDKIFSTFHPTAAAKEPNVDKDDLFGIGDRNDENVETLASAKKGVAETRL